MPSNVALILCLVLVVWFLRIERKINTAASLALWVPTLWLLITASRPIARWLYPTVDPMSVMDMEAGSPLDQLMMGGLIFLSLWTLLNRRIKWPQILRDNRWLLILFLYLGLSILWSEFPFVSFKRWVRLLGAVPIALVIMSEKSPFDAMESILRRCAYILIPFSFVLVKYFPEFGRDYNIWSGELSWTGVTLQKNSLGILCAVSACFLAWSSIRRWRSDSLLRDKAQVFANSLVLVLAMIILGGPGGSYSATSLSLMVVGLTLFLFSHKLKSTILLLARYLKLFVIGLPIVYLAVASLILPLITSLLGRDETFTGRTDIWRAVLGVAERNPILGVG
jgi:exopolysaccharide production protein ExoQ